MSARPHQCPVCFGVGNVPGGFYLRVGVTEWSSTSCAPEPCRSCGGSGIVWEPDHVCTETISPHDGAPFPIEVEP